VAHHFISDLDIDVTFSHQDDPAFCPEEKGETLDGEEREGAFLRTLVNEDAEDSVAAALEPELAESRAGS
jgi:hypothetical protein